MQDRRTSTRRRELLQARVFFNNRKSGFGCVLKDFSTKGARIGVSDMDQVPEEFELYVPEKQKAFPVRVKWRRGNELGLVFRDSLDPGEASASVNDLQKRVERLEGEVTKLIQLIEQVRGLTEEVARAQLLGVDS